MCHRVVSQRFVTSIWFVKDEFATGVENVDSSLSILLIAQAPSNRKKWKETGGGPFDPTQYPKFRGIDGCSSY